MATPLEDAKRTWLALTPDEREAFRTFISQQEAADDGENLLKLVKGAGSRKAFNGQLATLVAGSQRSGWVDVQTEGGQRISWRSGAWKVERKAARQRRCTGADAAGSGEQQPRAQKRHRTTVS